MIFFGLALVSFFVAIGLAVFVPRLSVGRAALWLVGLGFLGALMSAFGGGLMDGSQSDLALGAGIGGLMMLLATLGLMATFILWLWQVWQRGRGF